jgi:hypothetical protein
LGKNIDIAKDTARVAQGRKQRDAGCLKIPILNINHRCGEKLKKRRVIFPSAHQASDIHLLWSASQQVWLHHRLTTHKARRLMPPLPPLGTF